MLKIISSIRRPSVTAIGGSLKSIKYNNIKKNNFIISSPVEKNKQNKNILQSAHFSNSHLCPPPTAGVGTFCSSHQTVTDKLHLPCPINIPKTCSGGKKGWSKSSVCVPSCAHCRESVPSEADALVYLVCEWLGGACVCVFGRTQSALPARGLSCKNHHLWWVSAGRQLAAQFADTIRWLE